MQIPLIPDLSNPKWLIVQQILKIIDSKKSQKIASRLKIQDISIFIDCIKILILADTFEKDYSYVISEINSNINLKKFIGLRNVPEIDYFYKFISIYEPSTKTSLTLSLKIIGASLKISEKCSCAH